jgi:YesN/AraC family two-component response regulator
MTLLLSTDFSLSKVAEKIGVEDEAYFSRMFKKHTGISPNEYRKLFKRKKSE